jgi:DNA polymerase (family 10)
VREEYSWYDELGEVSHIGPARAQKIHNEFGIDSLDKLDMMAREGDLQLISGIGPATAEKIQDSIEELR